MLIHHRPRAAVGQIAFPFERLPVDVDACHGTAVGTAHIAYDGHGAWWVTQIEVSNPRAPGPNRWLPVSDPLWGEIRDRLDHYRSDDVGEAIERALAAGDHMRIFDEHRPRALHRTAPPPHARRRRLGAAALDRLLSASGVAVSTAAELVCIAAFAGGIWACGVSIPPRAGLGVASQALAMSVAGGRP